MRNGSRLGRIACLACSACLSACATNPAPQGWLPKPREAATFTRGGWVRLTCSLEGVSSRVEGELIAVEPTTLHVRTLQGDLVAVPTAQVTGGRAAVHSNRSQDIVPWGVLGTLSAISHGWWLILTVPLGWLPAAIAAPADESRAGLIDLPPRDWKTLQPWARFPQGLPEGVGAADLGEPPSAAPPARPSRPSRRRAAPHRR